MEGQEIEIINNETIEVFRNGSAIVLNHQTRSAGALKVGQKLVGEWEAAMKIEDLDERARVCADLDARSNRFLVNCTTAKNEMMEDRKAITALMDTIKGTFTEEENKLDVKKSVLPVQVQNYRNNYSKWLLEEKARKDKEAQDKANKAQEAINLKAEWNKYIAQWLINLLTNKKKQITDTFNAITLETYESKSVGIKNMKCEFDTANIQQLVLPAYPFRYHSADEIESMKFDIKDTYDYESFYSDWKIGISSMKQDLIGKLESKKEELDEAERLRLEAAENERKRQEALKKENDEKKRKELERQQQEQREKEQKEKDRLENEKKQREQEEADRQQREKQELEKKAEEKIEVAKSGDQANVLFDQMNSTAATAAAPAVKKSFIVNVLHPAGWIELIQFWYTKAGSQEKLADLEKKTFKQVKTFAEKMAKEGEMIESKHLKYEEDVKAINKKEKPSE